MIATLLALCRLSLGCGSDDSEGQATATVEAFVDLPSAPPVCVKQNAELLVFADYVSSTCKGAACAPSCDDAVGCPAGARCASGHCVPKECTEQADCDGVDSDLHCNTTTGFCELLSCGDDVTCPCGSYCDDNTHRCKLDCIVGNDVAPLALGCSGTEVCDTRGHCTSPLGSVPTAEVKLSTSPASLILVRDVNGAAPVTEVVVSQATTSSLVGTQPATAVDLQPSDGLSVACSPTGTLAVAPCAITGWTYVLQGSTYVATRTIRVQAGAASVARDWRLTLTGRGQPQRATLEIATRDPVEQTGRYAGTLTIANGGAAAKLPIQATVTATKIELHDAAAVIAPTGNALLDRAGGSTWTSFLGGAADATSYQGDAIAFQLHPSSLVFDPVAGTLTGELGAKVATSPGREQLWTFELTRKAALTTAPCATGETLDAEVAACVPGAAWRAAANEPAKVIHSEVTAWLDAMGPRISRDVEMNKADTNVALAERLLCFDQVSGTSSELDRTTLATGRSGDLQCTVGLKTWWGVGLVSYADRVTNDTRISQYDMMAQCLAQLGRPAPGVTENSVLRNDSCVSLARFYPALLTLAGTPLAKVRPLAGGARNDRRSSLLMLRLLQQWSQLTGFVARNGLSQRGVADILSQLRTSGAGSSTPVEQLLVSATPTTTFTYQSVLDTVDKALILVLDQRVLDPLLALPPSTIASSDYRQIDRPDHYWTFRASDGLSPVTSIVGGPPLVGSGCTYNNAFFGSPGCIQQAVLPELDRNLTVMFRWTPRSLLTRAWRGVSTLIDSDGLVVKEVQSADGGILKIGHRTADGTLELVDARVRDGFMTIRRDTQARVYMVDDGVHSFRLPYTRPPALHDDTAYVGASRNAATASTEYLDVALTDIAMWHSALSDAKLAEVMPTFRTVAYRAMWPSDVSPPSEADPDQNEEKVGVPVGLLEGLIPAVSLVEAFVHDADRASEASCRDGVPDDRVQRARAHAARSMRLVYAVQAVAEQLHATAVTSGPVSWEPRYGQALAELSAAWSAATKTLSTVTTCENALGLAPQQYPLYPNGFRGMVESNAPNSDLLEASAAFMQSKALAAISDANTALGNARIAWTQRFASEVQQQAVDVPAADRIADIRTTFGRELIDLCGVSGASQATLASTVLERFLSAPGTAGHLVPESCHIQDRGECSGSQALGLSKVNAACLRGQIGEAWLSAEAARQRVTRAKLAWTAARQTQDGWMSYCGERQEAATHTRAILDDLLQLQLEEADEATFLTTLSAAAEVLGGAATDNPQLALGGLATFERAVGGLGGGRKARLTTLLAKRQLEGELAACWFQADLARVPLEGAEQEIAVAAADLQTAIAHAATQQARVSSVVVEARAALAREANRVLPRIAFHYWADENLEIYQRLLARAQRMTYLYARAVEFDLQKNYSKGDEILRSTHPDQLSRIADFLGNELTHGFDLLNVGRLFKVVSLCEDVFRLPEIFHEEDCAGPKSARRFREILYSSASAAYEDGAYLGQALPFTLTPAMIESGAAGATTRCAEELIRVDARFMGDLAVSTMVLKVSKRESFYRKTCRDHIGPLGETQPGVLRSSQNLLLDGQDAAFGTDREWTRGSLLVTTQSNDNAFFQSSSPGANAILDLAGRGLYGDYSLIIPPGAMSALLANPDGLQDIKLRFDYVSVEDGGTRPSSGTANLVAAILDASGNELPGATGNSVTQSCAECAKNTTQSVAAVASPGWRFAGWSGACAGTAPSCSLLMSTSRSVWATFVPAADSAVGLSLTNTGTGTGVVAAGWLGATLQRAGAEGSSKTLTFAGPATITLVATPADDAAFVGWSGACTGADICQLALPSSGTANVTANFTHKPTLTIRVDTEDGDPWPRAAVLYAPSLTVACDQQICKIPFPVSPAASLVLNQSLTDTTNLGFVGWFGDCTGRGACRPTMNVDHDVTARFRPPQTLTATVPVNGVITASPRLSCGLGNTVCSVPYTLNDVVSLFGNPGTGYRFVSWGDGAAACGGNAHCDLTFTGATTVSATFAKVTGGGGGGGGGGGCLNAGGCQ